MVNIIDMDRMSLPALKKAMQAELAKKFDEVVETHSSNADIFLSFLSIEFDRKISIADRTTQAVTNVEQWRATESAYLHWARMPQWTLREAAAILSGIDPNRMTIDIDNIPEQAAAEPAIAQMKQVWQILKRLDSSPTIRPDSLLSPAKLLEWAVRFRVHVPEQLAAAIRDMWPETAAPTTTETAKPLDERERASLLRIIRALDAMAKLPERGAATPIETQLQQLGFIKPSEATIRKVIEQARAVEPDKPQ